MSVRWLYSGQFCHDLYRNSIAPLAMSTQRQSSNGHICRHHQKTKWSSHHEQAYAMPTMTVCLGSVRKAVLPNWAHLSLLIFQCPRPLINPLCWQGHIVCKPFRVLHYMPTNMSMVASVTGQRRAMTALWGRARMLPLLVLPLAGQTVPAALRHQEPLFWRLIEVSALILLGDPKKEGYRHVMSDIANSLHSSTGEWWVVSYSSVSVTKVHCQDILHILPSAELAANLHMNSLSHLATTTHRFLLTPKGTRWMSYIPVRRLLKYR